VLSLREQLKVIDDAYLIGIANKGLVNRAHKEVTNGEITVTVTDSLLEAAFSDGTAVKVQETLTKFECSCPSRTICKHVLMAFIKAAQTSDTAESTTEASIGAEIETGDEAGSDTNFDYLLVYTQDSLVKEYGKKVYNDILFKIKSGEPCLIEEGSILNVKMMEGSISVRFLPASTINESICTCKTSKCPHRLEAILQYIRFKTGALPFEIITQDGVVSEEIIPHVMTFVEDVYRIGLFRLPPEYSEKCSQFATLCHGAGFAIFERLFEACGYELNLYEQKNAGFNINRLIKNLAEIYQVCNAIRTGKNAVALAGKFKRQYMELPKIQVLGLGAYPWYAASGFCGVTAVFYCIQLKRMLTFSSSLPAESENEGLAAINKFWKIKSAWNLHISLDQLAKGEFSLTGAKVSDNGRLSSSESTTGNIDHAQTDCDSLHNIMLDDFTKLKDVFSTDIDNPQVVYAVLKPTGMDNGTFNRITQEYTIYITDRFENSLVLTIPYSKTNEITLLNFEYMEKQKLVPEAITVSISIAEDKYEASIFPIAFWKSGELKNIGKERIFTGKKPSSFAKFFK